MAILELALVSVQVTELIDGVFIGFTINHCVADGTSLLQFIKSLSKTFTSIDHVGQDNVYVSHEPPVVTPVLLDGLSPIQKLPYLEPHEFITRVDVDPRLRERLFRISPSSIAKLKAKANAENSSSTISSFQALAAQVWMSINRTRNVAPEEMTTCFVPMDIRPRLNPPLAANHFGTMVHPVFVTRKVGELLNNGLGWTAMVLNQAIVDNDYEALLRRMKAIMEKPYIVRPVATASSQDTVTFAGSVRFDMYETDFGLGRAVAILNGLSDKSDGRVIANQGREGAGSVDLEVCLLPENMTRLESDEEFMSFVSFT